MEYEGSIEARERRIMSSIVKKSKESYINTRFWAYVFIAIGILSTCAFTIFSFEKGINLPPFLMAAFRILSVLFILCGSIYFTSMMLKRARYVQLSNEFKAIFTEEKDCN